jgi:hypothetical protein
VTVGEDISSLDPTENVRDRLDLDVNSRFPPLRDRLDDDDVDFRVAEDLRREDQRFVYRPRMSGHRIESNPPVARTLLLTVRRSN